MAERKMTENRYLRVVKKEEGAQGLVRLEGVVQEARKRLNHGKGWAQGWFAFNKEGLRVNSGDGWDDSTRIPIEKCCKVCILGAFVISGLNLGEAGDIIEPYLPGGADVAMWNDEDHRAWEDVESVLDQITEDLNQLLRPSNENSSL